jgi:Ser/Thr protein kinase RdoA (MazF antagonist)
MTVKTTFTRDEFVDILLQHDLGAYIHSETISQGTVQTNYFIQTTQGKFVFRYYENRTNESVLFESHLLAYLKARHYPCPAQIQNKQGEYVGTYRHKPYAIFEFVEGKPIEHPHAHHWQQLIQKAAELQKLTQGFHFPYTTHRWNYDPDLCQSLAHAEVRRNNTETGRKKLTWLTHELTTLDLPSSLPKGICHCDFHFSNVLFQEDKFVALLDFDDANYTFLQFDLVGLIEYWAWPHTTHLLDLSKARSVVQEYMKHRSLSSIEQQHLYDVYKLSILLDCIWYFNRGSANDFREKRKINALTNLGRQNFFAELFHSP